MCVFCIVVILSVLSEDKFDLLHTDIEKLPGCNPLQAGPESATMVPNCDAVSTTIGTPQPTEGVVGVV